MMDFFDEWDHQELAHPWGINVFRPFLSEFGVTPMVCEEIDSRLYLDLANAVFPGVRRIQVEGRHSGVSFWLHVTMHPESLVVGFQHTPDAPMARTVTIEATPCALMNCIVVFHRWALLRRLDVGGCGTPQRTVVQTGERRRTL